MVPLGIGMDGPKVVGSDCCGGAVDCWEVDEAFEDDL
jgi:hypothetical protein